MSLFVHIFDIISVLAAELENPKIGISGNGLIKILIFSIKTVWCLILKYLESSSDGK